MCQKGAHRSTVFCVCVCVCVCWGEMIGGLGQENETQLAETHNMVFTFLYTAPDVGARNPSCFIIRNAIFSWPYLHNKSKLLMAVHCTFKRDLLRTGRPRFYIFPNNTASRQRWQILVAKYSMYFSRSRINVFFFFATAAPVVVVVFVTPL